MHYFFSFIAEAALAIFDTALRAQPIDLFLARWRVLHENLKLLAVFPVIVLYTLILDGKFDLFVYEVEVL